MSKMASCIDPRHRIEAGDAALAGTDREVGKRAMRGQGPSFSTRDCLHLLFACLPSTVLLLTRFLVQLGLYTV